MRIKWLIRTVDTVALGEDSEKKGVEYVESDSLRFHHIVASLLPRDADAQSQSKSVAIIPQEGLGCKQSVR